MHATSAPTWFCSSSHCCVPEKSASVSIQVFAYRAPVCILSSQHWGGIKRKQTPKNYTEARERDGGTPSGVSPEPKCKKESGKQNVHRRLAAFASTTSGRSSVRGLVLSLGRSPKRDGDRGLAGHALLLLGGEVAELRVQHLDPLRHVRLPGFPRF